MKFKITLNLKKRMGLRFLFSFITISYSLFAQNFAVLHWNNEYSKSINYSSVKNENKDSVEIFYFSHLDNEASTEFRNFTAFVSNGENEIKSFEKTDTLKTFKTASIRLFYLKESYFIEQQFSFMEDEEFEEVGDDFMNSKRDSISGLYPKKILQENYYWVGKNLDFNGKNLGVLVERNTKDEKMLELEKTFLLDFMETSRFTNFDAHKFYSNNPKKTEKSVFSLMKSTFEFILNNDTAAFFQRIINYNDYTGLSNTRNKPLDELKRECYEIFDKAYLNFKKDSLLISLDNSLSDLNYRFFVKKNQLSNQKYLVQLHISVSKNQVIIIEGKVETVLRGLVFQQEPSVFIDSISSNPFKTNFLILNDSLNIYKNKKLYELLNGLAGEIRNWSVESKALVLHLEKGDLIVKLKGSLKSENIKDFDAYIIKSVKLFENESPSLILKKHSP